MKTTLIIAFVLCSLSLSSLGYGPFPLISGQATTSVTDTQSLDRYEWNPMHVGDKWWYEYSDGVTTEVTIAREVIADTLINGSAYFQVLGIGGDYGGHWLSARGDTTFVWDSENFDDDPSTSELPFFRWDLEQPGDTCWVYNCFIGYLEIIPTKVTLTDVYSSYGFEGEELITKVYSIESITNDFWMEHTECWIERYGIFHHEFEFGVLHLVACQIDGEFFGDPSVDIEEEEQPPEPGIHLSCFPNPFHDQAIIRYNLVSEHASGDLSIYNLRGQLLRTETISGTGQSTWDGRDSSGKRVASGVYLCRIIDNQGNATTNKLMMIK